MRILAATPYYEPEGGGLERYAHAILRRLAERGHDVRALSFTATHAFDQVRDRVAVERIPATLRLGNTPLGLGYARRCRALMRDFDPDVVLAHTPVPFAAEAACRAARRAKVPFVVTYHAGRLRGSSAPLGAMAALHRATAEARMLAGASRLIAVSPYVRDHALARHRGKTVVIPPGVDAHRYSPGTPKPDKSGQSILLVAPLRKSYRWKGFDVLLDAQRLVQDRFPRAQLTVVGDGELRSDVARRAHEGRLNLLLAGRVSEEGLVQAYRNASVVALPSTTDAESFGMVLAEANACERPVVASAVGGVPDFVRDGENGLLARPGDANDLAEKLCTVLADPATARRMGERGRRLVLERHDWDHAAVATEKVLLEAAGK